jgi:ABC-2 type transport system ATP-binding protein
MPPTAYDRACRPGFGSSWGTDGVGAVARQQPSTSSEPGTEVVIQARGLVRRFGDLVAVAGLDLDVHRGEVFGFLGPNGAGKSTAIRMLVGLLAPSAGTVRVLGREVPAEAELLRPRVGYMTQRFSLYDDLTLAENLEFAAEIFGLEGQRRRRRIAETLEEYGLVERTGQIVGTLSGGWKQRLALAVATVHEPELLLLDEPTAGVDPDNRRLFWAQLFEVARRGTTILVSTHYMDEALRCHRLCVVRGGRRAALGQPAELLEALAGRIVDADVVADLADETTEVLEARPEVLSVTQLGNRLHVLCRPGVRLGPREVAALHEALAAAGLAPLRMGQGEPFLEDVFVALAQGERLPGGTA